ncbi:hypothetical protein RND81_13G202000 [Saponaria officinalis]|uniref:F-box domain-containing protein n=1 Tax=Saponaria officinalis TaxID=3572 RepID=A0AAW1H017_SAPOF
MENKIDHRPWDELMPDTLGLIFKNLPLDEILNVVPSVCKSWANAVRGPYCWQEIDISHWSRFRRPESLDRMLILLIGRSCGSLRKICVYGLGTELGLSVIGDNAENLWNLRLPGSEISNSMVEQVAGKLSNLTFLDLSYCTKIGAPALASFGTHCKHLKHFQRNMHPWDVTLRKCQDDEALAISVTMPQLKHLELAYLMVTTMGVLMILSKCHDLELLDMRGCWNVKLDEEFLKNRPSLKVVGPLVVNSPGKTKVVYDEHYDFPHGVSSSLWDWGFTDMDIDDVEDDDSVDVGDDAYVSDDLWDGDGVYDVDDLRQIYFGDQQDNV